MCVCIIGACGCASRANPCCHARLGLKWALLINVQAMADIERQLAGIFQVSEEKITMMRRKGSLYSLIDIATMVTALDSNAAKHQVTSVTKNYPEVGKAEKARISGPLLGRS